MDSYATVNGHVHQQPQTPADSSSPAPSARHNVAAATRISNRVTTPYLDRISNRASTPYPEIVEAADSPSSLPFHLAESAANASMELQQQLNLMAQAIAIQNAPSASSATLTMLSQQSTANSATNLRGASNSGLSNMLDQYISATAAAAVTAIQQQQLQLAHLAVAPYNQQIATVSSTPATVANLPAPLAAYLQTAASSQPSPVDAAIQLLQHTQDNASAAGQPQTNPTMSLFSTLCPCNVSAIDATATTPCPFHSQQHNNDGGSSNSQQASSNVPLVTIGGPPAQLGQQQRQHTAILVGVTQSNSSIGQQRLRSSSIIQHPPSSAAVGLAAAIQSHRMARSSLKRPSNDATTASAASVNGPAEEEGVLSGTAAAVHVSSPPPLLISPNATSVRLSSGLGHLHDGDGGGPSRGPKLRRLASFGEMIASDGEITPRTQLSGHVATSDLTEFRAPSVASASTAVTSVAAAIVQLQQQAAVAALPSAVTFFSSLASVSPPSTAIANSHQQQHNLLSHHSPTRDTALSSPPSVATPVVADPTTASLAAELGTSSASLSAGVEQIVAAALNAATAANAAFSPQTIAAMAAATAFPPQNATAAPQCAVCAAAACQSRMGPSMAAAVTACSCLHHHHHHLHCHHNALVPPPPFPVCSLCNYVASSGSPSPSTTTMPQTLQNQHSSNSNYLNNSNNSCINATGTSFVGNSHGINRNSASGGVSASLQPTAQIVPIAQRYLAMNPTALMGNNGGGGNERVPLSNNISANVNIHASAGGSSAAMAAAAALSPSTVTAMLLNSAAAMGQHNHLPQLVQTSPSIYSLQRNLAMSDFATSQQTLPNVTSMQQSLLVNRMAQQEREREAINHFYQQQQQRTAAVNAAAAAAAASQQHHLMRPLIMVPRLPSQMDLANVLLLHNSGNVGDAATLVLNGSTNAASALAHASNPHHIVANAMATATAPEPQPVGVSLDQIKKHSQKLAYVKDPDVPEQERDRCTVCLADFDTGDELRALNCTHLFHTECIDRWLQYNKKCPVCRVDMDKGGAGSSATAAEAAVMLNAYAAAAAASATSSTTSC